MWYKLRIIISHVCLFFSTWGTGQLETPLLFHLNQWAAVWSSFHKWIHLSKVQTLPRSLSCIFCMFSGLRPLVFQQVSRSPADGSSFSPAFAHCFNFYFFSFNTMGSCYLFAKLCLTLCHGLQPTRLLCPWDFPGRNTGVGCYFLLQGIVPSQTLNLCLLHWQADSLPLSHQASTQWNTTWS